MALPYPSFPPSQVRALLRLSLFLPSFSSSLKITILLFAEREKAGAQRESAGGASFWPREPVPRTLGSDRGRNPSAALVAKPCKSQTRARGFIVKHFFYFSLAKLLWGRQNEEGRIEHLPRILSRFNSDVISWLGLTRPATD
ncbi:hypothetical protein MRX96_035164 [Rhipicephalus microplus]